MEMTSPPGATRALTCRQAASVSKDLTHRRMTSYGWSGSSGETVTGPECRCAPDAVDGQALPAQDVEMFPPADEIHTLPGLPEQAAKNGAEGTGSHN